MILLTHIDHSNMASAVTLALAAEDRSCRIVCPSEVATQLQQMNMVESEMIYILNTGFFIDLDSILRIRMVHGSQNVSNYSEWTISSSSSSETQVRATSPNIHMTNVGKIHGGKSKLQSVMSFNSQAAAGWVF